MTSPEEFRANLERLRLHDRENRLREMEEIMRAKVAQQHDEAQVTEQIRKMLQQTAQQFTPHKSTGPNYGPTGSPTGPRLGTELQFAVHTDLTAYYWAPRQQLSVKPAVDTSTLVSKKGGSLEPAAMLAMVRDMEREDLIQLEAGVSPSRASDSPRRLVLRMAVRNELAQRERDDEEFVRASLGIQDAEEPKVLFDRNPLGGSLSITMRDTLVRRHSEFHKVEGHTKIANSVKIDATGWVATCRVCCWSYNPRTSQFICTQDHEDCEALWNYATRVDRS